MAVFQGTQSCEATQERYMTHECCEGRLVKRLGLFTIMQTHELQFTNTYATLRSQFTDRIVHNSIRPVMI